MRGYKIIIRQLVCVYLLIFLFPSNSFAHRVNLFCYVEEDVLYGEGYYRNGKPVKDAHVEVFDSNNNLINKIATDKEGKCSIKLPSKENIKLVLNAGMGHVAECFVDVNEIASRDCRETHSCGVASSFPCATSDEDASTVIRRSLASAHSETVPSYEKQGDEGTDGYKKAGDMEVNKRKNISLKNKPHIHILPLLSGLISISGFFLLIHYFKNKNAL